MPDFIRNKSAKWHSEIPGARWFHADLHIHTLDDHIASSFRFPDGITGKPDDEKIQISYARAFLKAAVANKIEVLGLTPHAVRAGKTDETSATWRILETWNNENDDDDVPFRDKIYAIFPGFEPNLKIGAEGIHFLFLFDPEIGREQYLAAFNEIMGALPPYEDGQLRLSTKSPEEVYSSMRGLKERLGGWDYLCLAAHAFSDRGLFRLKSQVLQWFPHENISALELKDNSLPEDELANKDWLKKGIEKYHHAFFHSSDSYEISKIGSRFTLMKMASPSIEALRQAFLGADSRLRIAYIKNGTGQLILNPDLPDSLAANRPWLKSVSVKGGTSFFAGRNSDTGTENEQEFRFNPDLTCIIGGRMSGKSTLLDGLRVALGHQLPSDENLKKDVTARANKVFLSGNPTYSFDIHGPINPTMPEKERWPAQFYTQRELITAVGDQKVRRDILYRLIPDKTEKLVETEDKLNELDLELKKALPGVATARTNLEEAEEEFKKANQSKEALKRFEKAGIEELIHAQSDNGKIDSLKQNLLSVRETISKLGEDTFFKITDEKIKQLLDGIPGVKITDLISNLRNFLEESLNLSRKIESGIEQAKNHTEKQLNEITTKIQKNLVELGGNAEELNQFSALMTAAGEYESVKLKLNKAKQEYLRSRNLFLRKCVRRSNLVTQQRELMNGVIDKVAIRFAGKIRIHRFLGAIDNQLENWIFSLKEAGITKWWNRRAKIIVPDLIRSALKRKDCTLLEMSDIVSGTFLNQVTLEKKFELYALRNLDKYSIELNVSAAEEKFKEIDQLSGGAQVSVLLSLLLETEDTTPLIIDQPEDEIDKAYLFEVLLPALRRLKGKRQIIFATHDPNIVVNGDADQVISLKAEATLGRIEVDGAIENKGVKQMIINILDGGRDAFILRKEKYGF